MRQQSTKRKAFEFVIQDREGFNYYLSFFVWPFGVLLAALKYWYRPFSKNVFWIFCIFFGFTFIIAKDSYNSPDSVRYAQKLIEYAHYDISLKELWNSFYTESSGYVDIAQPLITYFVSRITDNPKILFAAFGFIFGYFYSRNIWYILGQIKGNLTFWVLLLVVTFGLINPIWFINGFRMWTAAQIFLFGALPYFLEGNSKKLLWSGISVFFHFSYLFPLGILLLYFFFRNRPNIYIVFFIVTSFIKEIDLQLVRSALSFLPDFFQLKVTSYTNIEYAESINTINQSYNWYITFAFEGIQWVTYTLTLFIYFSAKKIMQSKQNIMSLFCYSILLYGFANVSSLIPSGLRFFTLANAFMFAFFIIYTTSFPNRKGMFLVKVISIPLLLLFCIVEIRRGMDFYGLMTIFGNPVLASINDSNLPLIVGIKNIFF